MNPDADLSTVLTPRWTPLVPHEAQQRLFYDRHRFKVVPAGRRSGKTEKAKRKLVMATLRGLTGVPDPRYFAAAPTRDQAKAIYWEDLKRMVPPWAVKTISESHLYIALKNDAEVHVVGMDKPQRIEGRPWDGGVLDEYANMKPHAWSANVRPALSTPGRPGWCWFIGVPEGRNHYYDLYEMARSYQAERGAASEWAAYTWKSADIMDPGEVQSARESMDELTFRQEYEASFVNFEGRAYYAFDPDANCARLTYNPRAPLIVCFDFNVEPGVAVIAQEFRRERADGAPDTTGDGYTGIIGEVHIPRHSNTPAVCRKLLSEWSDHVGPVICYGDATGGAGGSAKVAGSDWDLIRGMLASGDGYLKGFGAGRVTFRVPRSNPPERARVNAVNTRCQTTDGTRRLFVDPGKAPHVLRDLEGVRLLAGGAGDLDKKSDLRLTHFTDALGYYVHREFPVRGSSGMAVHTRIDA